MTRKHVPADLYEAIFRGIDEIRDEMVDFLQELIRIPTVNPPGENYLAGAELIGKKIQEFGYRIQYISAEGRPEHTARNPRTNVIGVLEGPDPHPLIHFNGHFDVVPVGAGWTVDPFGGLVRDGKIYGRGSSDQKSGIAASIFAIEAIRRAGIALSGTVEQSGSVDEESGGFAGVAYLCAQGWIRSDKTDFVIITEPTDGEHIYLGHRGVYWFKVVTHGRIAHGSMPHLGTSAVDPLVDFLYDVNHDLKPILARRKTAVPIEPPESRRASINVNAIFGGQPEEGTQTPCVVDRSGAIFDRRFLVEESFKNVKEEILRLLESRREKNANFQYTLEDMMIVQPVQTDPQCSLVTAIESSVEQVYGRPARLAASPGTYDQKHVVRVGNVLQCVAYGPGALKQAHQPDEYCLVEELVKSAKVMALTAIHLLGTE